MLRWCEEDRGRAAAREQRAGQSRKRGILQAKETARRTSSSVQAFSTSSMIFVYLSSPAAPPASAGAAALSTG